LVYWGLSATFWARRGEFAMLLKRFHVTTFQGVLDSEAIEVDDITCLVGKNEAGKTALLKALYRLNPIRPEDAPFSVTDDYPRSEVNDYEDGVHNGEPHAAVIEVVYELEPEEISAVENVFGPSFLTNKMLAIPNVSWDPMVSGVIR
jgi:ABC-type phosphate/phosphonate transport system ATPase subunit